MTASQWKKGMPEKSIPQKRVDIWRGPLSLSEKQRMEFLEILSREDFSIDSIVEHYFCPPEIKAIQNSDPSAAFSLFFKFWTRKEAINKAMGKGLSFPLEKCNVSHIQGFDFSPVSLPDAEEKDPVWYVRDLSPEGNYAAALSLQYPEIEISFWDFPL
jgi:4'-phosphopantetheinyl transferase